MAFNKVKILKIWLFSEICWLYSIITESVFRLSVQSRNPILRFFFFFRTLTAFNRKALSISESQVFGKSKFSTIFVVDKQLRFGQSPIFEITHFVLHQYNKFKKYQTRTTIFLGLLLLGLCCIARGAKLRFDSYFFSHLYLRVFGLYFFVFANLGYK